MEYHFASTFCEIPPVVPFIHGDFTQPMENCVLDPNTMSQYSTNYMQVMTPPKTCTTWPACSQAWAQMVYVQVNPGEILTIKADDGSIQNIQGPADVPLIAPAGYLPPIYLPPGYISQVVEENGIQKLIVVPHTIDYQVPMTAPIQQPSPFLPPTSFVYPPVPQFMYPPVREEFEVPYIQEPIPQELAPLPPLVPLPPASPPASSFIYQELHEIYSHGRVYQNQFDENGVKTEYSKKTDCQVDEHKESSLFFDTPLLMHKTCDSSSPSDILSTYSEDCVLSTHVDDDVLSSYPSNTALSTSSADSATSIYLVHKFPRINITGKATSSSSHNHARSTSTTDMTFHPDTTNSELGPFSFSCIPKTFDGIPKSSGSISEDVLNISLSEKASDDNALKPSGTDTISNTARIQTENNHGIKENDMGSGDNKQILGGKQKSQASNAALKEYKPEQKTQSCCSKFEKPMVSQIQTRSAVISWKLNGSEKCDHIKTPVRFELALSNSGKSGSFKNIYIGDGVTVVLQDLQPSMSYFLRVTAKRGSEHRIVSEVVTFATLGCEPDAPLAPKLINRTKNSLNLHWKASNDNGSRINSFLLEWDEGKGEDFKSCYTGTMKQYKIIKLNASTKYSFRLAAKNNFGLSNFSEIAVFYTSGNMPPAPLPPKLKEAGIYSLSLEWCAPTNPNPNDSLTYVLEMDEAKSGLGFKPKYNGEDLSCTIRNLQRNTTYKFRMFAYNLEGRSNSSGEVKYSTCPDKPGCPQKPYVMGTIDAHQVKIGWESPKDDGGAQISSYSLEVSKNSNVNLWNIIYNGSVQEFLYDHLQPGTTYKLRVFCTSPVGQSQPSDILTIQTPTLPSKSCHSPPLSDQTKSNETTLNLDNPPANRNLETPVHAKKAKGHQNGKKDQPGSEKKCTPGSHCGTVPVRHPPQCGTPVLTCKGPACVIVSWEIPKCNGADITDYRLQWGQAKDSMHLIYTGPCLRYEVKNLLPATTYFCRVQAVNIVGIGMFGGTGKITTPGTVPSVVKMLQEVESKVPAKMSSTCIAIQWEEPDCHGSPITGYNIEYGDKKILTVARVTECILKNLQPNTTYKVRIQAINHHGLSPFSQSIRTKTKPLPPDPPNLECVVSGHQSLRLRWGNLSNKRSLVDYMSYNLLMQDRSGRFSVIYHGPSQTYKVQKLCEFSQYKFKIQACNEAGEGAPSNIYTFSTVKTPPAVLKAPKLHLLNNNRCEIKWDSLAPIKGDPIVYCLQVTNGKKSQQIYKGPNTTFSFSNYLANSRYYFKVCAGRKYENPNGIQELWGAFSPSTVFSTYKQSGHGKGNGGKGKGSPNNDKDDKNKTEMNDDTFVLALLLAFTFIAIVCAVAIQYFLIN